MIVMLKDMIEEDQSYLMHHSTRNKTPPVHQYRVITRLQHSSFSNSITPLSKIQPSLRTCTSIHKTIKLLELLWVCMGCLENVFCEFKEVIFGYDVVNEKVHVLHEFYKYN